MTEEKPKSEKSISVSKSYFILMLIMLILVDIVDSYNTNFPTVINSRVIAEFLSGYSDEEAASIFAACLAIATLGMYFVFVAQFLSDKFGRKKMLAFTTFGMGFSCLLLAFSQNIVQYTFFLFLCYVFFSSDMWLIFINEEAPPNNRASWTNVVLAGGVIGAILIPVFRSIYITETSSNWRGMVLFPIVVSIPLSFIILLTLKETSKFEEVEDTKKVTFRENMRVIFTSSKSKEFKIILMMSFLIGLTYGFLVLGESYIAVATNFPETYVNYIVYAIAISVIIGYLSTGILCDKIGRRPMLYVHSILMPIAMILANIGITENNLILTMIGASFVFASFWGLTVVLRIITVEIIPTEKRGTGSGMRALIWSLGITCGLLLNSVLILVIGMRMTFIILSLPVIANVVLIKLFIEETKGIDLSFVKA